MTAMTNGCACFALLTLTACGSVEGNDVDASAPIDAVQTDAAQTDAGPLLGSAGNPGLSCKAILDARMPPDGKYFIDPDGGGGNAAFEAFCDMTTAGGGWTFVGHLDSSARGRDFFRDVGTYDPNRADGGATYSAGGKMLGPLADTEMMVTIDAADPAVATPQGRIVFFRYAATHPAFQTGPVPCSASGPDYGYRLGASAGAYTPGGHLRECTPLEWYASDATSTIYLLNFSASTANPGFTGVYFGDSWAHDGYFYVR